MLLGAWICSLALFLGLTLAPQGPRDRESRLSTNSSRFTIADAFRRPSVIPSVNVPEPCM